MQEQQSQQTTFMNRIIFKQKYNLLPFVSCEKQRAKIERLNTERKIAINQKQKKKAQTKQIKIISEEDNEKINIHLYIHT